MINRAEAHKGAADVSLNSRFHGDHPVVDLSKRGATEIPVSFWTNRIPDSPMHTAIAEITARWHIATFREVRGIADSVNQTASGPTITTDDILEGLYLFAHPDVHGEGDINGMTPEPYRPGQTVSTVINAFSNVPDEVRELLHSRFLEGKTYTEIGQKSGYSKGSARKYVQEAINILSLYMRRFHTENSRQTIVSRLRGQDEYSEITRMLEERRAELARLAQVYSIHDRMKSPHIDAIRLRFETLTQDPVITGLVRRRAMLERRGSEKISYAIEDREGGQLHTDQTHKNIGVLSDVEIKRHTLLAVLAANPNSTSSEILAVTNGCFTGGLDLATHMRGLREAGLITTEGKNRYARHRVSEAALIPTIQIDVHTNTEQSKVRRTHDISQVEPTEPEVIEDASGIVLEEFTFDEISDGEDSFGFDQVDLVEEGVMDDFVRKTDGYDDYS